ncbi:MAG: replication initiation and membrane attachment family protein [Bacilli bacterium]
MKSLLPADIYIVYNKTILKEEDRKIITTLYQPIIGHTAVSLYFTLIDDLDKRKIISNDLTHYHLMTTMQLKLDDILLAREKLEAAGLLKTYYKEDHVNQYVYLLFSPLSPNEFLNHPILNVVLYNNLGKKEYNKIVEYYKIPHLSTKDYQDITKSFNEVFTSVSGNVFIENDNIITENTNKININNSIDFDLLISSIPKNMISNKCFNEETKSLINSLSYIYKIDSLEMQGLVRNSLNERGLIDKQLLRKSCRNYYQYENNGKLPTLIYKKQPSFLISPKGDTSKRAKMVYTFENITPYDYLKSKYNGGEPSTRDLKLIETLLVDFKLQPGVVNVLLSYVLKINNQKLNKNYIETIAGQWKRLNIETVEEAMQISEKEHKKMKKKLNTKTPKSKEESLPIWFDKEMNNPKINEEDKKELDELLKEFV